MKELLLTNGFKAIVDDIDFKWASLQSWYCHESEPGRYYARGSIIYRVRVDRKRGLLRLKLSGR